MFWFLLSHLCDKGVFGLILMSFFPFQLKGRAIEVGGGTFERIPSADLRLPRDSDPDVVIQVKDLKMILGLLVFVSIIFH